jgi:hypothetical protein
LFFVNEPEVNKNLTKTTSHSMFSRFRNISFVKALPSDAN